MNPSSTFRRAQRAFAYTVMSAVLIVGITVHPAYANTSVFYDFNTPNQLTGNFISYQNSGPVITQSATGGLSGSGAINSPTTDFNGANAVFATRDTYSFGPAGSTFTMSAFVKSDRNRGHVGMGLTSLVPSQSNATSADYAYRPTDALGVSLQGSGFVFHHEAPLDNPVEGAWDQDTPGITTIKKSSIGNLLNVGSADKWYKVELTIERKASAFDMTVSVWPSTSAGVISASPEAVFKLEDLADSTLPTLNSATSIRPYINFSGERVTFLDDFQFTLALGSSGDNQESPTESRAPELARTGLPSALAWTGGFLGVLLATTGAIAVHSSRRARESSSNMR